jgi:hypothetical protein
VTRLYSGGRVGRVLGHHCLYGRHEGRCSPAWRLGASGGHRILGIRSRTDRELDPASEALPVSYLRPRNTVSRPKEAPAATRRHHSRDLVGHGSGWRPPRQRVRYRPSPRLGGLRPPQLGEAAPQPLSILGADASRFGPGPDKGVALGALVVWDRARSPRRLGADHLRMGACGGWRCGGTR